MNQENMSGNPTLDLLNQATGMNEFKPPIGNGQTGNPTLDLLSGSTSQESTTNIFGGGTIVQPTEQSFNTQENMSGNPTLDLLNGVVPQAQPQTSMPIENPMIQGNSQFVSLQPEVEVVVEQPNPVQDIQAVAFGNSVNQPSFVQQSPEALFGGSEVSGTRSTESEAVFNPFDFTS